MEPPGRRYLCARCGAAVLICSHCDRGNRYCAGGCARAARTCSQREAGRRYQASPRGRRAHAARQHRYRSRQTEKVTHQGSPLPPPPVLLPANPIPKERAAPLEWHCHFCGRAQPEFVRQNFLHRRIRRPPRTDRRESPHDPDP